MTPARRYVVETLSEDSSATSNIETVWAYSATDAITQIELRYSRRSPTRRVARVAPADLPPNECAFVLGNPEI
jgi:hypothetical protein